MVAALLPAMVLAASSPDSYSADSATEIVSVELMDAQQITYTDYLITSDELSHVETVLAGIADVTRDAGTGIVTIKLTSDVAGRICLGTNSIMGGMTGKFVIDLGGKTIDPGTLNEAICLDHGFEGTLSITGDGTLKAGANNIIYFGWNALALNFNVAEGKDYFTLKDGDNNVFDTAKNAESKEKSFSLRGTALVIKQYTAGTYTVSFNANGGEGAMADQIINELTATALSANTFTRDGFSFLGWAEESTGSVVYDDAEEITDIAEQNGTATLYAVWALPNQVHPICGNDACTDINHTDISWTAWGSADALPNISGNYYLLQDVTLTESWSVPDSVNLCLNGHTVEKDDGIICSMEDNDTLSICDCQTNGKLSTSGNSVNFAGNDAVFNLYGGTLYSDEENPIIDKYETSGNTVNIYGGRVACIDRTAIAARCMTVNLYGGEISVTEDHGITVRENGKINLCGNTVISHGNDYDDIKACAASVIDATGYTGDDVVICYENTNLAAGDIVVMNVTDETADKFSLSSVQNTGYVLEREGNNLVLVAEAPQNPLPSFSGGGLQAIGSSIKPDNDKPKQEVTKPDSGASNEVKDDNHPAVSFTDLDKNAWYYKDVEYVIENGIFNGITANAFAPNGKLTRAMLVTVLYRIEGEPATNRSIPFADIDMGAYYGNAVSWAQQNGIVNGVSETKFAPNDNITREQIAAIMFRYAQYKGMDDVKSEDNLKFEDSSNISEYAFSAMNWAVGTELLKGKTNLTLNPKDNATRAETAAILHRFIEINKK